MITLSRYVIVREEKVYQRDKFKFPVYFQKFLLIIAYDLILN